MRPAPGPVPFAKRWALGLALLVATTAGWFALAGRTDWLQGWIFSVAFAAFGNGLGLWLRKTDPGLLEERSRPAATVEPWGQTVVSQGLYGVVRHPMYVAIMLWALLLPLALGSFWALVPGALTVVLFIYRTAREDRMLQERLAGYPEYATRVRYRLLPGIW